MSESVNFVYILGKTVEEAAQLTNLEVRATWADGEPLVVASDYRPRRLNVKTVDGLITEFVDFG